jgi:hypothetical protein
MKKNHKLNEIERNLISPNEKLLSDTKKKQEQELLDTSSASKKS